MPVSFEQAKQAAVAYIGLNRNRASGKIKAKLAALSVDPATAERVIDYLKSIDYIDDRRAAAFILKKHTGRNAKSRFRLDALLQAQGIPARAAAEALAGGPDDEARALDLIDATFGREGDWQVIYKRLLSRGFHPDLALALARKHAPDNG